MTGKRPGTAGGGRNTPSNNNNNATSSSSPSKQKDQHQTSTTGGAGSPSKSSKAVSMSMMNPSASAATALLDQMERLLGDADNKFVERSKTLIEAATNSTSGVTLHVDRGGASLRQQVAHNHTLMADRRFKEMLDDCERCLAPEFSLRGDVLDRALQAMLASLLKALLKESASLSSHAARKVQIEMTFQWWQDKRREILDVVLSRMPKAKKTEAQDTKANEEHENEKVDDIPPQQRNVISALTGGDPRDTEGPPLSVAAPAQPLAFKSDMATEKNRSAVAQNLRLYMRHDLAAAHAVRTGQMSPQQAMMSVQGVGLGLTGAAGGNQQQQNLGGTTTVRSQPRVVMNQNSRRNQNQNMNSSVSFAGRSTMGMRSRGGNNNDTTSSSPSVAYFGAAHENAPAGPQPYQHLSTQAAPRGHTDRNSAASTVEESLSEAHQRIVRHTARKLEDRHSSMEATDMNSALSHNRARLLEETARKLESREFSSQTGRTAHLILSKVRQSDGSLVDARTQLPSARFEKEMSATGGEGSSHHQNGTDSFSSSQQQFVQSPASSDIMSPTTGSNSHQGGVASGRLLHALKKSSYQGSDLSFSPYDHYQLRPGDEQKLKELMDKIAHINDGNGELPPVASKHAVFDDKIQMKHAKRNDLRVLIPKGVAGSNPAAPRKRLASAPSINHRNARRGSGGAVPSNNVSSGKTPQSPAAMSSPLLSASQKEKANLRTLMKDLFPEVFDGHDELPPSMRKLEEMKLVDKIRDAFAKRNPEAMPSYDRLVRALVTPDDLPHEVCLSHMPRPGSGYPKKFASLAYQ